MGGEHSTAWFMWPPTGTGLPSPGKRVMLRQTARVLEIRIAGPEDAADIASVHVRSWQVGYRGLLPDEYLDGLRPEDRASRYTFGLHPAGQRSTIVAVIDTTICGMATTGPSRDNDLPGSGELYALYVDPDRWGLGIGRRLLAEARAVLCRSGSNHAHLWVLAGNNRAERFYRADQWRADGRRRTEEIWGIAAQQVRFRRHVALATAAPQSSKDPGPDAAGNSTGSWDTEVRSRCNALLGMDGDA